MINVRDFGAKGDGVANDTVALQTAINVAASANAGAEVFVPTGTYLVDGLTLPNSSAGVGVTIRGPGSYSVSGTTPFSVAAQLRSRTAAPLIQASPGAAGYVIRDLQLNGNGVGTYGFFGNGNEAFLRMIHVLVTGFTSAGISATMGLNEILFCYVTSCANGVDMGTDGRFIGNHVITNAGWGVRLAHGGGTFVAENEIAFSGSHGLWIDGTAGNNSIHLVANNYVENNNGWGIYLVGQSSSSRTVTKCRVIGNYVSWIASSGAAGGIYVKNARTVQLLGNNMTGSDGSNTGELQAVLLEAVDTATVTDLVVEYCYRNPIKLTNVSSTLIRGVNARNYAYAGTTADDAYGILVDAACFRVQISDVKLEDLRSTRYGRGIKTASSGHTVVDYYAYGLLGDNFAAGTSVFRYDVTVSGFVADVAVLTQDAWTAPTLAGTWTNFGAPHSATGYYKDRQGTVHLRGVIKSGGSSILFTLPAGYRPLADLVMPTYTGPSASSPTTPASLYIPAGGNVTAFGYNAAFLSLDGISFRAEQ